MPYVGQGARLRLTGNEMAPAILESTGELNYLFTCAAIAVYQSGRPPHVLLTELVRIGKAYLAAHEFRYGRLNDVAGALVLADLEFQRRMQAQDYTHFFRQATVDIYAELGVPYERTKIQENGDVYPDGVPVR